MSLRNLRTRRAFLVTLGFFAVCVGWTCHYNERAIERSAHRLYRHACYRLGDDAILNDLSAGRIKSGDSVEELMARHPPTECRRHDNFVTLRYNVRPGGSYEAVHIVARDGRIIVATAPSCCYVDVFFLDTDEEGAAEYSRSASADFERWLQARQEGWMAVVGFGATIEPWNLPRSDTEPER